MRYDLASLEQMVGAQSTIIRGAAAPTAGLGLALGFSRVTVLRARRDGLSVDQADRWAVAAGFHPANVWPSWVDDLEDDLRDAERAEEWWARLKRYRRTLVGAT